MYGAHVDQKNYDNIPAWDALDRHVLRFYGWFSEDVIGANLEKSRLIVVLLDSKTLQFRVRRVILYYYLEDDSIQVVEPKVDNAGIPQGAFVRRHRIPRAAADGGGYIMPQDIRVGQTLNLYARKIKITDADHFTRVCV